MRRAFGVALPLTAVLLVAIWRSAGPEPRPASAPLRDFSSARAVDALETIFAEGAPHPIGTRANARVRSRVVQAFEQLGYRTEVQRRFACSPSASCGMVENVIATAPGAGAGNAVLVVAHYDSVGASPGVSDDGMGIAALLETARAIRGERFRNRVVFLAGDGEEAGLLGAEAFVADKQLSRGVAVVVNIENRGTWGASNMFETSRGNRWLARHMASSLARPQASSFFYSVYAMLPNDTDVSVFRREGVAALNFAAIRGVGWYHTALDDLAHASPRTMQHHGENALAMVRTLADADLDARSGTDATYFDLLGFGMIWWPQEWTTWMIGASFALLLFGARRTPAREMTFGVLTCFAAILLAAASGFALSRMATLRSGGLNWVAHPLPSVLAMWLAGSSAAVLAAAIFRRRAKPAAMLYGIAIVWHMIAGALAFTMPGASFVFLVPAAVVAVCAAARCGDLLTAGLAATAGAMFMFPIAVLLYDALGGELMAAIAVLIAAFACLFSPLFPSVRLGLTTALAAIAAAAIAIWLPAYDAQHPRPISLSYLDDPAAGGPRWITRGLTPRLRRTVAFEIAGRNLVPWSNATFWSAAAPDASVPRVHLACSRAGNHVTIVVRPARPADRLELMIRGEVRGLRVNGVAPPKASRFRAGLARGWRRAAAAGVPEMTVEMEAGPAVDVVASDVTFGLPAAGTGLARTRDASNAIRYGDGDVTITRARGRV